MVDQAYVNILLGAQELYDPEVDDPNDQQLLIPLQCPFCHATGKDVATWGRYPTKEQDVPRYYCYPCKKSFNPAQLPFLKEICSELIWKLAQLTIEDKISINSLAQKYYLPYSTIRRLINYIKSYFASVYEITKQLHDLQNKNSGGNRDSLRIVAYDEGFLKLLGLSAYLLFTVDKEGKPLTLHIEEERKAEVIYNHLLSASSQLGGIDIFIADGAPAILTAVRALRSDLLFIRHIHKGTSKRAQLIQISKKPNKKKLTEITIELHTGSLLQNTESIITVSEKEVYAKTFDGNKIKPKKITSKKKRKK